TPARDDSFVRRNVHGNPLRVARLAATVTPGSRSSLDRSSGAANSNSASMRNSLTSPPRPLSEAERGSRESLFVGETKRHTPHRSSGGPPPLRFGVGGWGGEVTPASKPTSSAAAAGCRGHRHSGRNPSRPRRGGSPRRAVPAR